ncbi:ArsR/SmtB family transcription factor [Aurantimicrobium minutum]|uniref:ArsR family transcriptional regulator n=1 Tax=Aurantimicrobium minutum TaxID=708131 RepID=A0A173LYU2_9MICO|nr:metalloregulator ArsR/SmtB family transcription factor [Aurantimicrobium minutum]MDH6238699.1 ArsR family transcriptional regulator [Aurantimicrobium minutum]BAV00009.1 ArsR family transcriptional regulator [Aurantimicrobium minutum]
MADIFDVVADETRREILQILLENLTTSTGEMSVSELVSRTGLSQPTVSKQLKVLREAGVVGVREDGQHRLYHLDPTPLEELEDWVIPFLSVNFPGSSTDEYDERLFASEAVTAAGSSVGSAAATTVFQVTQAFGDLQNSTKDAVNKLTSGLRKKGRK